MATVCGCCWPCERLDVMFSMLGGGGGCWLGWGVTECGVDGCSCWEEMKRCYDSDYVRWFCFVCVRRDGEGRVVTYVWKRGGGVRRWCLDLTGLGARQIARPFALVSVRAGQILSIVFVSSDLLLKSVEPQFSGCRVYLLLTETSRFDLLWPFCRRRRCCHRFDLWADHCVVVLHWLYPLENVCATQKLLFDLMLHHRKPYESVPQPL